MKTIQIHGEKLEELESAIRTIIFEIDRWCDDSNFDNGDELGVVAKGRLQEAAGHLEDARAKIGKARTADKEYRALAEIIRARNEAKQAVARSGHRFIDNIFETGEV